MNWSGRLPELTKDIGAKSAAWWTIACRRNEAA